MPENLKLYWRLARLDKPVGWLLLLWPTLWAVRIAGDGEPQPGIVVLITLYIITCDPRNSSPAQFSARGIPARSALTRPPPAPLPQVPLRGDREGGGGVGGSADRDGARRPPPCASRRNAAVIIYSDRI